MFVSDAKIHAVSFVTSVACGLVSRQQQTRSARTVFRSAVAARRARAVATRCCTARSDEYIAYSIWCSTLPAGRMVPLLALVHAVTQV